MTDPSGTYRSYKAVAVGKGREVVESILLKEYREDLTLEESIRLAVKCLVKAIEQRGEKPRLRIAVIPADTKKYRILPMEEVEKYIREFASSSAPE